MRLLCHDLFEIVTLGRRELYTKAVLDDSKDVPRLDEILDEVEWRSQISAAKSARQEHR
jgi:hypothetical protein